MEQAGTSNTMKITDLSFDCLESCLQHLNIDDLLNVADCNKQLNYIARYTISRQFKGHLALSHLKFSRVNAKFELEFSKDGKILVIGNERYLKTSLQFLRICGDLVSELKCSTIFKETESVEMDLIVNYVNEYCSEFLTTMKLMYCSEGSMAGITKPFVKVERIEMETSFPFDKKLSELFPNMRELVVACKYVEVIEDLPFPDYFFADHYPSLEHLSVVVNGWEKHYEKLAVLLQSNPQLKSLYGNVWLHVFSDTKIVSFEHIQNLEKLGLKQLNNSKDVDEIIYLKNLRELVLQIHGRGKASIIPFRSDKLESLELEHFGGDRINILNLISNYPSVKKLKLSSERIDHFRIQIALPLLEEIDFWDYLVTFTVNEVVHQRVSFIEIFSI